MESGSYDANDPHAVEAAKKEAEQRDREDDETFRVWMTHPKGRELLARIAFEVCHLAETFMAADDRGRSDTHRTYLQLGERNIGAWLDERMRRHPELYMQMLQEQEAARISRGARLAEQNERQQQEEGSTDAS